MPKGYFTSPSVVANSQGRVCAVDTILVMVSDFSGRDTHVEGSQLRAPDGISIAVALRTLWWLGSGP